MIRFAKAHAYGNDFLYVDEAQVAGATLPALAREMCDRHAGIGADGLIVYVRTPKGARMRLFNADGGRAEVSGNGVRGLAAWLLHASNQVADTVTIETEAGAKEVVRLERAASRQTFRTEMGLPSELRQVRLQADGVAGAVEAVVLNFGNPQCVLLGPLPSDEQFRRVGSALERHPMFPDRTNVEFAFVERGLPDRRVDDRHLGARRGSHDIIRHGLVRRAGGRCFVRRRRARRDGRRPGGAAARGMG